MPTDIGSRNGGQGCDLVAARKRKPVDNSQAQYRARIAVWRNARRVLVICSDSLTSAIMLEPAARAVRAAPSCSHLGLQAGSESWQAAGLLPPVDRAMEYRAIWHGRRNGGSGFPQNEEGLIRALTQARYDAALVLTPVQDSPYPPAYACYLAGIPLRAAASRQFGGAVLSDEVRGIPDQAHEAERYLAIVEYLGFPVTDRSLRVVIAQGAYQKMMRRLGEAGIEEGRYVVVHPGAGDPAQCYSPDRFARVVRLVTERTGLGVVLTGGDHERQLVHDVAKMAGENCESLAGETTLEELAAVIQGARAVVTNRTVTVHLADALRRPSVVMAVATTLDSRWRPRDTRSLRPRRKTDCSPCNVDVCRRNRECLDVASEEVVEALMTVLD